MTLPLPLPLPLNLTKAVALGKATKNREALESAKPNKLKTATTVMAAVSRLGDAAGEKDR